MPVDPITLGIPDYLDIIKKPMDLGTIEKKLKKGEYSDPWEYVDDVWLMFDNAWLYNRKTSRVYRYCTKVSIFMHHREVMSNEVLFVSLISCLKYSSRRLTQSCKHWATAVAESTRSTHKCSAAMANNSAQFHAMPSILAI